MAPQKHTKTTPHKAPPATQVGKFELRKVKNAQYDIELNVQVLADGSSLSGTETTFELVESTWNTPGTETGMKKGQQVVTKVVGSVVVRVSVKIQTVYGPGASASQLSAYGRGTMAADKAAGNTSLGFHESCHRNDCMNYVKRAPLDFGGKAGMTLTQFELASKKFDSALKAYLDEAAIDAYSVRSTDEVGVTKTLYNAKRQHP